MPYFVSKEEIWSASSLALLSWIVIINEGKARELIVRFNLNKAKMDI